MRSARALLLVMLLGLMLPAVTRAQTPTEPRPIDPPCGIEDCWWPIAPVATLEALDVDIEVIDGAMRASYEFHLSNPGNPLIERPFPGAGLAEGRIVFPVPPGSSVSDLVLSGGPETLEGRLLDADEAQRIYEEIVRRQIDPALLRSLGGELYEVRAFPVPVGEERQVSFTVTTPLLAEGDQLRLGIPWSRMSPRPAAATVDVEIEVPWEVRAALAPGFDLDIDREGSGELLVSWESGADWRSDTDFSLYLTGGEGLVDARLLTHRPAGDDGYFALLFAPVVEAERAVDRDIVVVLDTSGSMRGDKIDQARDAATYVLEHLGEGDRFGVVSFARRTDLFGEGLHPASDADLGVEFVQQLEAAGGTNISGALDLGLSLLDGDRPSTVIFLTDGLPTAGITSTDGILDITEQAAPERTQLFAFGVGYDVDTVLLDALAGSFVGSSHYVTPDERIDTEVARLFERVSTPVLTDLEVTIVGVDTFDLSPTDLTGIFAGNQTLLTGRYEGSGSAVIRVRGNTFEGDATFTYDVDFPAREPGQQSVAQLWAQHRVADLLTEVRLEGARKQLIDEIVEIATQFGIVTPYTAYLAEEPQLAFDDDAAGESVERAAAAPSSGADAVDGASDLEELRGGTFSLGGQSVRVIGTHSYILVDGVWTRDGYEATLEAPEVLVGTADFAELVEFDPDIAAAAALGEHIVVLGPDGWRTLVWPAADSEAGDVPTIAPAIINLSDDTTNPPGPPSDNGNETAQSGPVPTEGAGTLAAAANEGGDAPLVAIAVALGFVVLGLLAGAGVLLQRRWGAARA